MCPKFGRELTSQDPRVADIQNSTHRWKTINEAENFGTLRQSALGQNRPNLIFKLPRSLRQDLLNLLNEDANKGNENEVQNEAQFIDKM